MSGLVEVIDMLGTFGGIFISIECDGEFGGGYKLECVNGHRKDHT